MITGSSRVPAAAPLTQLMSAPQDESRRPGSVSQTFGRWLLESSVEQRLDFRVGFAGADADFESRVANDPLDHVGGREYGRPSVDPDSYSNPTNGPIPISSAVISTTQTALMTSPAGSMSNIR